jgi:hypothetical protein
MFARARRCWSQAKAACSGRPRASPRLVVV